MSFTPNPRRRFDPHRARFVLPPFAASPLMRVVLLAVMGILAAAWALASHTSREMPPLRRPIAPAPASTYDADAGEMPVPEIGPWDGG